MNKQTLFSAFIACLLLASAVVLLAGGPAARPARDDLWPTKGWATASLANNDSPAGSNGSASFRQANCSGSRSIIRSACDEQTFRISYSSRRICTDATFNTSNRS